MTQSAQAPVRAEPGPRPSSGSDLYTPQDWALIRAPLLPARAVEDVSSFMAPASDTSLLPRDPRVRAAIQVGSPDLAAALGRTHPGDPEARRVCSKITRYLLRMCARPTPYGLFAGVGLIGWGPGTDVMLSPGELRTRTRPDMQWMLDFVSRMEEDPAVRTRLSLRANQAVIIRGGRAFLSDDAGISVRASGPVRRALELSRAPVPYAVLAGQLATSPGATQEKAERLIDELMGQGFLHSDLRPPATGTDPVGYVADRLTDIPAGRAGASGLRELASAARAWDEFPAGDRAAGWDDLLRRARRLHLAADAPHLMQTDLALPLAGSRLHADIGTEAARAAGLLLSMTAHPYGAPHLDDYRHRFESRYGLDRHVPLLELLDVNFGLGPPSRDHADPPFPERDAALGEVALRAHRDRALAVELDDELLGRLQTWRPGASALPASLEIPVFIAAASPAAIDAGDYQLIVGPNVGPCAAGRSLGRFADLLGPSATAALGRAAAAEAALHPGVPAAEIAYLPDRGRMGNVLLRPAVRSREIVFSTTPGVPDDQLIPVDELVVGVHAGRFVVCWPQGGDLQITAVQGHMVNPALAPPAARFLLDVADGHRCELRAFDWGPASAFPFLPRIQRGRIVLSLARWRLDSGPGALPLDSADGFSGALAAWRQRWGVPRRVYLAAGDNRLLLDLDHPEHHELLRSELRSAPHRNAVTLQEALPGPQHAWLPGADGGHMAELIVPLMARPGAGGAPAERSLRCPAPPPRPSPPAGHPNPGRARFRLPGSDWLYLKLSVPPPFQDDLIAGPVREFAEFAVNAQLADGWHFLRYRDPDPHLRIRFHGEPTSLLGPLLTEACSWAADLVADGTSAGFGIETYDREVERYGGEDGMRAAEAIFNADSKAVAEILRLSQDAGLPYDLTAVAVLTVADLLAGLDLGTAEDRAEAVSHHLRPSRRAGQEYRERKRDLRLLLSDPASLRRTGPGEAFADALALRRSELAGPAARLRSLERDGRLTPSRAHIGRSLVHLHVNRLLGMNREDEQLVLQLLRYTWQGLSAFPAGRDHGRDALCAEAADRGVSRLTPPRHCAAESPPP